jgi:putative secretion ATPase (PEP-CTERM system associated)
MYEIFYNFTAEPFRLSPDHRFCFEHNSYGKARAYLAYAFKRAEGFVMITGRPGTGKTTLIGELIESLSTDKVVTANLVCTQLQADDLLKTVAYSFGVSPAQAGKAELMQHLSQLLHSWHREGRRALLVVDEAQDLSASAMEELRLLTNIQYAGQPLLQIFLLGQPELRDLILSREMEQVHQRIVAASHIEGLEADETEAYVMHRLSRVGWQGDPAIDRAIFPLIHRFSEGVPRRINLICSRLFLLGSVEERHAIEVKDVSVVIGELQAENLAAGTGISREDFRNSAKPDWVPVPDGDGQVAPPLQGESSVSAQTAGDSSAEESAEAKKKDNLDARTVAEEAVVEESTAEESAAGESVAGESTVEESTAEESTAEESTAGESAAGESAEEEPAVVESAAEEPVELEADGSADASSASSEACDPKAEGEDDTDTLTEVGLGAAVGDKPDPSADPESEAVVASEAPEGAVASGGDSEVLPIRDNAPAAVSTVNMLAQSSSNPEPAGAVITESGDANPNADDTEANLMASGGVIVSPAPRKRLIFIACLMAVALTAALVLKTCVLPRDETAVPDMGQEASTDESAALVLSKPAYSKPASPQSSSSEPASTELPSSKATSTKPVSAELTSSNAASSKSVPTEPTSSEPTSTEPATPDIVTSKPVTSKPAPSVSTSSRKAGDKVGAPAVADQMPDSSASERAVKPKDKAAASTGESVAGAEHELLPMVVEAGLRLLIPAATAGDTALIEDNTAQIDPADTGMGSDESLLAMESTSLAEATEVAEAVEAVEAVEAAEATEVAEAVEAVEAAEAAEDSVAVEIAAQQRGQETFLISFSFDSAALDSDALPELDRVVAMLRASDAATASITGFTDNLGDSQYNLRLSRKRADAVERYLVQEGIARDRLHVEGRGVLSDPVEAPVAEIDDPMEPYRIVQIKLLREG